MDVRFYVDIEDTAGTRLGSGPITSAISWRYTARMDRAGSFEFTMPASDEKASLVQKKRVARAWAWLQGGWVEVGAGVIDRIEVVPGADGVTMLVVAGDGEERLLTYRSVGFLELDDGSGGGLSHVNALSAISALAPSGWTFNADTSPGNDYVYGRFAGESVLEALILLAKYNQTHFYRSGAKTLTFSSVFTDSGVHAIRALGDLVAETCAIVELQQTVETYDLITRIYPFGAGQGRARLTLAATNRTAPSGYTLNASDNYIANDSAESTYGRIERYLEYKDIAPISNSTADLQAAANMLFDVALEELRRRSSEIENAIYRLRVAECAQALRPMQRIRVSYHDPDANIAVDDTLNILESTIEVSDAGLRTTELLVASSDRWPVGDTDVLVEQMAQGRVFQAHPQLNANSYSIHYAKPLDDSNPATLRWYFGDEVTQVQQVLLQFTIQPLESTVKAVGGATSGSGDLDTTAPNINETGTGGNNETGLGGPTATGSGGPTTTGSTSLTTNSGGPTETGSGGPTATGSGGPTTTGSTSLTTNSGGPTETGSGGPTATGLGGPASTEFGGSGATASGGPTATGSTSLTTNSDGPTATGGTALTTDSGGSGTTGSGGGGSTGGATGNTGGPNTDETGQPQGGGINPSGEHVHSILLRGGTFQSGWYTLYYDSNNFEIKMAGAGFDAAVNTQFGGNHTHSLNSHIHSLSSHAHSLAGHAHSIPSHAHSIPSHTHSIATHTHSIASHTHSISAHTHSIAEHTHQIYDHTHSISQHTHSISQHTHSIATHTHSISAHTHSIATHTHSISQHTHSIATHTHSISAHTHSIASHTHSLAQHTHTLNNHTHDLSESITAIYGIFREISANTRALSELQYTVNGGAAQQLSGATALGNGWYEVDITSQVVDATTLRPLQASNELSIAWNGTGTAGKTCQIEALLNVRNIIQAIAYT